MTSRAESGTTRCTGGCNLATPPIPSGPERRTARPEQRHRKTARSRLERGIASSRRGGTGRSRGQLSWPAIATSIQTSLTGWKTMCPRGSLSSPYPTPTTNACVHQTASSDRSSRNSSGARPKSGSFQTSTRWSVSQPQYSLKSTKNGKPKPRHTSNGNSSMNNTFTAISRHQVA